MLLICVATAAEGSRIEEALGGARGQIEGREVALVQTGVGPVNAAHALTLWLARSPVKAVVSCGIGGAYPGSGLSVGDVACAETEIYADLGADSEEGFLDMRALGFPVVPGDPPLFNRLPLDRFPAERRGVFVTAATCTGTAVAAREIAARTGGAVESMEGAAIVHVALLHGIPVGEVRGISNMVGDRDRAHWDIPGAADAAQAALLAWIRA